MATVKGIGQPLQLTDEQLEEAAQITQADIEAAVQLWRNTAPRKFKTLLDAAAVQRNQVPDDQE